MVSFPSAKGKIENSDGDGRKQDKPPAREVKSAGWRQLLLACLGTAAASQQWYHNARVFKVSSKCLVYINMRKSKSQLVGRRKKKYCIHTT